MEVIVFILLALVTPAASQSDTNWEAWRENPERNWNKDLPPPPDPKNVRFVDITSGSMRVEWEAPTNESGITSYDIKIEPAAEDGKEIIKKHKDDRRLYREDYDYIFEHLRPDYTYEFRLRSIAGNIASSGVVSVVKTDKALRCYQCTTAIDYSSCQDTEDRLPFQDSSKLRDCYYKLSKGCTKFRRGWGDEMVVSRGCSYLNTTGCTYRWSRGEWEWTCNCVGNACNGANTTTVSSACILAAILTLITFMRPML